MNKIVLSFLVLLSSSVGFAQEVKITSADFLSRLEKGEINMRLDPMLAVPETEKAKIMGNFKKNYPGFKDAYWFVPNLRTNKYLYTVHYQWPTQKCIFRAEEIDPKTKVAKPDPVGEVVAIKYCEKAYGIKIGS